MIEHNPEPSRTHVMRPERTTSLTARAQLNVTRTIGPWSPNTSVMFTHLGLSPRVFQVDAHYQTSYVVEE